MSEEGLLEHGLDVLVRAAEAAAALVILIGVAWALVRFVVAIARRNEADLYTSVRLTLGRFLALGLEFQLAADLLRTAIAPTFAEIGQVAAIAAIRTALNYFLSKEIEETQREVAKS